jgi:glutamate racemase
LDDPVTDQVIARYLDEMLEQGVDTLVLGCTHYPLLRNALSRYAGTGITLVDSAQNCALKVESVLNAERLKAPTGRGGSLRIALTDQSSAFLGVAEQALGLKVGEVQLKTVQMVSV